MTRILVVEDDASIRDITAMALRSAGHQVDVAASGGEALDRIGRGPVDVILLDIRMPVMDGAEFARRYRELVATPAPIIVLTAARDATLAGGDLIAARYLEKPFDLDDLLNAVDEVTAAAAN
jgi:CheY-like chemotaxis protein